MQGIGNRGQETGNAFGIRNAERGTWNAGSPNSEFPIPNFRSGITLLEVLISIGVLSVGVLGAATLLPMATYFQNEATKFDRGAALAQQAVHDLQIKNYLSPRRWVFLDPANPNVGNPVGVAGLAQSSSYSPFAAIVLDPLGFSYVASQKPAVPSFPCYFPAFPNLGASPPGGGPSIYRAGITANDYWPAAATVPVTSPVIMSFPVADRLMRSNDDILFDTPSNSDMRPTAMQFASAASGAATAQTVSGSYLPDYAGDFSWIATVSRVPSDMIQGPAVAASLHRFQVSVVVLQKRDLTLWAGPAGITLEQPPPERQVYAMFTQYGGQIGQNLQVTSSFYGGGGMQLYVYEGQSPTPGQPSRHWLDNIKPNTYLMLTANFQDMLSGIVYPQLAWYRILNVDDGPNPDPQNNSRWYRNLTVSGGDWPAMWYQWTSGSGAPISGVPSQLWYGADPNAPNAMMPYATGTATTPNQVPIAFCTLMDDAVAEYDQTITLDYSLVRQ